MRFGRIDPLSYIKSADTLLCVYLVTRKREHIYTLLLDIYINMAECLNSIGVEDHFLFLADSGNFLDRPGSYRSRCLRT